MKLLAVQTFFPQALETLVLALDLALDHLEQSTASAPHSAILPLASSTTSAAASDLHRLASS